MNGANGAVAVGAVIDVATKEAEADLPVVLAVGINYGQGAYYLNHPVPLFDSTGMRAKLGKVFSHLANHGCPSVGEVQDNLFHLVSANFFPWITNDSWAAYHLNSIEEAAMIHCCGHAPRLATSQS